MMTADEFRKHAHALVDFMADYVENTERYPVKSQVEAGDVFAQIPDAMPNKGEDMEQIMSDFQQIIMPGITHWQSPNFFAYFPANSSYPSLLAEMLTATLGAQCMIWETSPAAAELEEKVLNWLRDAMRLPSGWSGVIQDTASTATLCAILTAREKASNLEVNRVGLTHNKYRVYCSTETHSSIEKAVKIAGLGKENLIKIGVDEYCSMLVDELEQRILADKAAGFLPICVVSALGTTSTTACDPIAEISRICRAQNVFHHVDAAYAGSALLLEEYQHLTKGMEQADSFVFNPHKWLFTNFDCSAYYVKDEDALVKTFTILPEYLKTKSRGQVNDYRDWGVPLGRRFRALKLWFVLRNFGLDDIKNRLRKHIEIAKWLEIAVEAHPHFVMMAKRDFNLVCFRYDNKSMDIQSLNQFNENILEQVNQTGEIYITHTKIRGVYTLRMVVAQTRVTQKHVAMAWELICKTAAETKAKC